MRTTLAATIVVGTRQRKNFNEQSIRELAASIEDKGLIHPPFLREHESQLHLVAGERRIRACKLLVDAGKQIKYDGQMLALGHIPYSLATDLDEVKLREAELEENLRRVDLTWQEEMQALAEVHELKAVLNPNQSVNQTGREVAENTGENPKAVAAKVSQARVITDHLDDPNVAKAKSASQAYQYIIKNAERELRVQLEKASVNIDRPHILLKGDCREVMAGMEQKIDLILTDPPYGMGADAFGNAANLSHKYDDTEENALAIAEAIFVECFHRLTGDRAHLYMFCDIDNFQELRRIGNLVGWKVQRTPLIWHKTGSQAHAPSHEYGHKRQYELILFAMKGDKPFDQVYSDVISVPQVTVKDHAAQKPAELYAQLIRRSCLPGDKVLDPCCGSGTIFAAAELAGVVGIGIEQDEQMFTVAELAWLATKGEKPIGQEQKEASVNLGSF